MEFDKEMDDAAAKIQKHYRNKKNKQVQKKEDSRKTFKIHKKPNIFII